MTDPLDRPERDGFFSGPTLTTLKGVCLTMIDANISVIKKILAEEVEFFTDKVNPSAVYVEFPLPNNAICFSPISASRFHCKPLP